MRMYCHCESLLLLVKFRSTQNLEKYLPLLRFDSTEYCQILSGIFFSNFVCFSECPKFTVQTILTHFFEIDSKCIVRARGTSIMA